MVSSRLILDKQITAYRRLPAGERRTLLYDSIRQGIEGGGEPLASVLFLYIGIEFFELPSEQKAFLVASRAIGFCLAPFLPLLFSRCRLRRSSLAAICNLVSGVFLLMAANTNNGLAYTIFCILFVFFLCVKVPLFTYIYRENYHSSRRGKLFALGSTLRNVCNLGLNLLTALVISNSPQAYRWVLGIYSIFIVISGLVSFLIPSQRFNEGYRSRSGSFSNTTSLKLWHQGLKLVLRDRLFLYICLAWYFLGFGNLALIPMRVEFLLSQEPGSFPLACLSPVQLVLTLQILPGTIRSIGTFLGGKMFDRIPLLQFRILTNLLFIAGTMLFFQAGNWWMLLLGVSVFGLAEAGAQFIWNLWVTHLAPGKEYVELYMSIHVFLNGTRGLIGPFVSYALLARQSWTEGIGLHGISGLSWLSVGLMLISTLMFASMAYNPRVNLRS